jgi:large subunit ribosomal protein L3
VSLGLLGNKIGMTQIFDRKGNIIPVTIIKAGPCYITQLKSKINCGYNAIQIGYVEASLIKKELTKPEYGHFIKNNLPAFRYLKEFQLKDILNFNLGQKLDSELFKIGEHVNITGFTIGKGNTGNIKLHKFNRGPMSHGSKHHRLQGSMGAGTSPGRVFPGKKMPRRSGMEKRTIQGLEIIDINPEENLLIIKGSIPGKAGNLVSIKRSKI